MVLLERTPKCVSGNRGGGGNEHMGSLKRDKASEYYREKHMQHNSKQILKYSDFSGHP